MHIPGVEPDILAKGAPIFRHDTYPFIEVLARDVTILSLAAIVQDRQALEARQGAAPRLLRGEHVERAEDRDGAQTERQRADVREYVEDVGEVLDVQGVPSGVVGQREVREPGDDPGYAPEEQEQDAQRRVQRHVVVVHGHPSVVRVRRTLAEGHDDLFVVPHAEGCAVHGGRCGVHSAVRGFGDQFQHLSDIRVAVARTRVRHAEVQTLERRGDG
ncbi:hypothetical protein EVG20_g4852, partial [Dentipellis fragilis]